ncbi:hypothetical protein [Paenibacillus sp. 37]|uniref:hypothetical protein n=1 Tax=Paenibacillus sp. 37 TaxID=2607911 RepID=UPI00122DF60F|nr:hypothetical protein [Paenibacillus sp. 37]
MLTLYTYESQRPDNNLIEKNIIKGRNYTYITATKALASVREREGLIPEHQYLEDDRGEKRKMILFSNIVRAWTKQTYMLSSRGEEKVMLYRAMNEVSKGTEHLRDLLRHDYSSWIRILYALAAQGIDLRHTSLPDEKRKQLVNPVIETHLKDIQSSFYDRLEAEGKRLFEAAARDYLKKVSSPTDLIIMEGFTYFTDLQRWFIEQCSKQGKEIVFIVPYREHQKKAFSIIEETYKIIASNCRFTLNTPKISEQPDIEYLQRQILQSGGYNAFPDQVSNVHLKQYPNRDRELQGCITQLKQWFDSGYEPKDVAVVMRRSKEFVDRLRDYMEMDPLYYRGEKVELLTTPRLLLLTPVGRFVLNLYQIWKDNTLDLQADILESILSSGWLGAGIQDSTPVFRAVKYQYFNTCRSKKEWLTVFTQLETDCEKEMTSRLPLGLVDKETVRKWNEVIELLDRICNRLFHQKEISVGRHIEILQEELNQMLPKDLRKAERIVLEKIQTVFQELSTYFSIPLTTEEFGDAIHALTKGENTDEEEQDENEEGHDYLLRIVTPETLDGMEYKAVLYLGCDNVHVPVLYPEPWPFYVDGRGKHLMTERYMFLTVIRSAVEQLVLSYAQKDGDRSFQPSTYMQEVERLLETKREVQGVLDTLDMSLAHDGVKAVKVRSAKRKSYDLSELAHYGLCPLRYRLELLHPEARIYRTQWQLQIYAQSIWLNRIYGRIEQSDLKSSDKNLFYQSLLNSMEMTREEVRRIFPAFSPIVWHAIEFQVKGQLDHLAKEQHSYFRSLFKGSKESFSVLVEGEVEERTIKITFEIPYMLQSAKFNVALFGDLLSGEWLLPGKDESDGKEFHIEIEIEGVQLFSTQYQAVNWWRKTINSFFAIEKKQVVAKNSHTKMLKEHFEGLPTKIGQMIKNIESNKFPMHPGEHCTSCPVRPECLGISSPLGEESE